MLIKYHFDERFKIMEKQKMENKYLFICLE